MGLSEGYLSDEVTSINAIYGDGTLILAENANIYILSLPAQPGTSLRVEFPPDYPDVPPAILGTQHIGDDIAKGEGATAVEIARNVLSETYNPGVPCVFDFLEEFDQRLQQRGLGQGSKDEESQQQQQQAAQGKGREAPFDYQDVAHSDDRQSLDELDEPPPWTVSENIVEKKSIFIARAAPVSSVDQAKSYLAHLLATDKKAAKATHNITAWRIRGASGVQYQDCDDDGEDAAGGRLLHLLELMNVWGAMVVVSRWYGGTKLGPDRFRIINQCARDAIVRGELSPAEDGKDGAKKRGKK